ncbi:MAG TPA: hypothetical protein VMT58_06180 [Candidatus Binataceae bacterium]|nr:hypothetical protein [Candidatus Binataceae bacterium]
MSGCLGSLLDIGRVAAYSPGATGLNCTCTTIACLWASANGPCPDITENGAGSAGTVPTTVPVFVFLIFNFSVREFPTAIRPKLSFLRLTEIRPGVGVEVPVGVAVNVGVALSVAVAVADSIGVGDAVGEEAGVSDSVIVGLGEIVGDRVIVLVGVAVAVGDSVKVAVPVGVADAVTVRVGVCVGVKVADMVTVGVAVAVTVWVEVTL